MRALVIGALIAASLTGCSDQTDAYCSSLEDAAKVFADVPADAGALADVEETLDELRQAAPDDVRDEWDTFFYAWQGLTDAMAEAGIEGEIPDGEQVPEAVAAAAAELSSPRVADAVAGLEQHARDICKVDLTD
jgi:hypothetical protein